jgi:hypothetical protein
MRPPFPIETNNGPSTTSAAASDVSAQRGREADEEDCPVSPADRGIRPVRELNLDRLGGCRRFARRRGADFFLRIPRTTTWTASADEGDP